MANFAYTATKSFTPFTFEQMLKPMAMYTQEYNTIEEGIAELGSKADLMRMYANEEPDSKVANMYNAYANDLDKQAESLAKQGLTQSSRRGLLDLKRRYSSEITPIETAVTRRRQLAEEQRKAMAQDNSIMFDVDARTLSLDRLIESPELSYTPVSGKDIMTNVSKIAENLAKEARNNPNYFNKMLGGDYYEYVKQHGFSAQSVLDAINRSKNAPALLTAIVDNAVASSGVTKDWAGNAYDKAYEWANRGLWSAVGQTQTQLVDNWRAKLSAQEEMKRRVAEYENALKVGELGLTYKPQSTSHLEASGDLARYYKAQQSLMSVGGNGLAGLNPGLFGKTGSVNPLKVYEEYNNLITKYSGYREIEGRDVTTPTKESKEKALAELRNKYGVETVIDSDTYNALKELGYNSNSKNLFADLYTSGDTIEDRINKMASQWTEYSFNGDISDVAEDLNKNIAVNKKRGNSFANRVTVLDSKMNSTSEKFDPEDYEKVKIVDFGYTLKHKDKIIVTYADGTKVAVDPSLISDQMQNTINDFLENEYDEEESYRDNTSILYLMEGLTKQSFRGFNQSLPKTNAKQS